MIFFYKICCNAPVIEDTTQDLWNETQIFWCDINIHIYLKSSAMAWPHNCGSSYSNSQLRCLATVNANLRADFRCRSECGASVVLVWCECDASVVRVWCGCGVNVVWVWCDCGIEPVMSKEIHVHFILNISWNALFGNTRIRQHLDYMCNATKYFISLIGHSGSE